MRIKQWIGKFFQEPNNAMLASIAVVLTIFLIPVIPLLPHIPGHPDEHQFFNNAWAIMAGKVFHNYIHVAFTEYVLAGYLTFMNLFTNSGVNFPQGDPNIVAYFYGRILGLLIWIGSFIAGSCLLMKGQKKIPFSVLFFSVFLFGSIGMFERFMRINSDSLVILVTLTYLLFSINAHAKQLRPLIFFFLNLTFIFLISFTNLKALYMVIPIFALNTLLPFIYERKRVTTAEIPAIFRSMLYSAGVLLGSVALWGIFIPKPVKINDFWYSVKQTTVASVNFDYQYPGLAHKSWLVYAYDLIVHQIGLTQIAAAFIFIIIALTIGKSRLYTDLVKWAKQQLLVKHFTSGNLYESLELILLVMAACYYFGISSVVIHWSRWTAPLGFLMIMLMSSKLGFMMEWIVQNAKNKTRIAYVTMPLLLFLAWSIQFALILSIRQSDYPNGHGYALTLANLNQFIDEQGYKNEEIKDKMGWFFGEMDRVPQIDITRLGKEGTPNIDYLVWPQWGTAIVYSKKHTDLEIHNLQEFIAQYTDGAIWRFPSPISRYVHVTKQFAQGILGITWLPETEALTETQYAILKMKKPIKELTLHYEVPFAGMEHYYSPKSYIFSMKNLHDSNIFPPCHGSPTTLDVKTGLPTDQQKDEFLVSRIVDMHCHSIGIRMALQGTWRIRIVGLPENINNEQKVYSAYPFEFDPITKTITHRFENTKITAAFGVATKEKNIPGLKFIVDYIPDK